MEKTKGKILIAGNGGSAADAMHMATEFTVKFYSPSSPLAAIALSSDSCVITAAGNDFNFEYIFSRQIEALGRENDVFIAISTSGTSKNILNAIDAAKKKNITVSCDLNYRKKLWSKEKANKVMSKLVKYVDVLISNEEDSKDVFGIEAQNTDINAGVLSVDGYESIGRQLMKKFPALKYVAFTLRESVSASRNGWSAILIDKDGVYKSKKYMIDIVDRVGGGDSFGAGLIYGLHNNLGAQNAIEFAVAASCLKHTVEGDFNVISVDEVNKLAGGDGSGRVQR